MTFSVVAFDRAAGAWGVAVASRFLAVGALAPAAEAEVGAIVTQGWANLQYRGAGLSLLRRGLPASAVLDRLVGPDPDREKRQVGLVDRYGGAASWTGAACEAACGHHIGRDFAIQGNTLLVPTVLDAMVESLSSCEPRFGLAARLVQVLQAGEEAGGDKRGPQSASVLVARHTTGYFGRTDVEIDLRVDDAAAPIEELKRLVVLHETKYARPHLEGEDLDDPPA